MKEKNIVYKDHTALWKIEKKDDVYLILNHLDEVIDKVLNFEEAYSMLNQYKNSEK